VSVNATLTVQTKVIGRQPSGGGTV